MMIVVCLQTRVCARAPISVCELDQTAMATATESSDEKKGKTKTTIFEQTKD